MLISIAVLMIIAYGITVIIIAGLKSQVTQIYTATCNSMKYTLTIRHKRLGIGPNYEVILEEHSNDTMVIASRTLWETATYADKAYYDEYTHLRLCEERSQEPRYQAGLHSSSANTTWSTTTTDDSWEAAK